MQARSQLVTLRSLGKQLVAQGNGIGYARGVAVKPLTGLTGACARLLECLGRAKRGVDCSHGFPNLRKLSLERIHTRVLIIEC